MFIFVLFLTTTFKSSYAQNQSDSIKQSSSAKKILNDGIKLISTSPKDTIRNESSTNLFLPHQGKIIRNIDIDFIGFERSLYDSSKKVNATLTKAANSLHSSTKERTIRELLFIHKDQPLDPYKLADNERFIRNLDFILDSRFLVIPVPDSDSVDLVVTTRDVFSLGAAVGGDVTAPEIKVYDANLGGFGQRLEFTGLFDASRSPQFGYSALYRKYSVFGSLTDMEVEFTQLNNGLSFGQENEYALRFKALRSLVSPNLRLAGGMEVSKNWSENVYNKEDSVFLDYTYKVFDVWTGYNLGIKKSFEDRGRKFLAIRYFDGYFLDKPEQEEYQQIKTYNNSEGILSEFTIYRQDFYKTRYIYAFGITEDVPTGISLGLTGGYLNQIGLGRPYTAVKFNLSEVITKGNFYNLTANAGGFIRNNAFEDLVVELSASYYTKIYRMGNYKLRNILSLGYTGLFNQIIGDGVAVTGGDIPGFKTNIDSLNAKDQKNLKLETVLFTPWSLIGFRFATFAGIYFANLGCPECSTDKNLNYIAYSAGLRTRNENLIFGTIELRFIYIPNDETYQPKFAIQFKQNLRIKYNNSIVQAPSPIRYN